MTNYAANCWGRNDQGQLGLGHTNHWGDAAGEMGDTLPLINLGANTLPFVELGGPATVLAIGANHTCALLANGSVKCWGLNDFGQLGLGDTNTRGDEPNEMGDNLPTVKLFTDEW